MRLAASLRYWLLQSGDGFLLPLVILAFFWQLGTPALFDLDEGAFSAATWEMLQRGDYITTFLNGQPRFDKPILIYWLQAISVHTFGLQEWSLRLPSALAASTWVITTYYFVKARFSARSAMLAAVMLATSAMTVLIGRAATADALLNLCITLSLFDLWRYWEKPSRLVLFRLFFWLGCGFLTKGPIAVAIPLLVSAYLYLSQGQWRTWLQTVLSPYGWIVFLAIALPWYALEYAVQGQAFIDGFFLKHNLDRFADTMEGHGGTIWYYFIALPFILLPFSGLLLQLGKKLWRHYQLRQPLTLLTQFLLVWVGLVFIFFSFSNTQLPHYLLYGITPLIILLAVYTAEQPNRWLGVLPALIMASLFIFLPEWLTFFAGDTPNAYIQGLLQQAQQTLGLYYRLAAIIYTLALGLLLWWKNIPAIWRLVGTAVMQTLFISSILIPALGFIQQSPVKQAGYFARQHLFDSTIVMHQLAMPSFTVYREKITPQREPAVGEYVFTQAGRLQPAENYYVVFQKGGVVLARRMH